MNAARSPTRACITSSVVCAFPVHPVISGTECSIHSVPSLCSGGLEEMKLRSNQTQTQPTRPVCAVV